MSEAEQFAVVGVLARVSTEHCDQVKAKLNEIPGVTPFSVEELGKLGLVIERASTDEALQVLQVEVETIAEVLGTWPVFSHCEPVASNAGDLKSIDGELMGECNERSNKT